MQSKLSQAVAFVAASIVASTMEFAHLLSHLQDQSFPLPQRRRFIARFMAATYGVAGGSNDYLPARDADLDIWQQNFYFLINAGPGTYGLDAAYAAALQPLSVDFTAKLAAAVNPATKTSVTVAQKDASKAALKSMVRIGASIVQATPSVLDANKLALGLPVHNNAPSPIPAPVTFPILGVNASGPLRVTLRYSDQLTPDSRRKPAGAAFLLLASKTSATVITDPEELTDGDIVTVAPFYKSFSAPAAGKNLYVAAKWVTRRGLEGPWSAIVSCGIAA